MKPILNSTYMAAKSATVIFLFFLFTACAATLAPNYDKAIVDGLVATNIKLMEHFASTSSGTTKDSFKSREQTYNNLIGNLDALTIQAKARPVPVTKESAKVNDYLNDHGIKIIEGEDAPSATALEKISATIVKMKATDKKQGVTATEVAAFKGQVVIYLDQAITYENYLER